MKQLRRILLIFLCCVFAVLALVAIAGGGFGKKEIGETLSYPGNRSVLLFAHRGIKNYFPENSEVGFEGAKDAGFKAIETDIQLSSDDSLVVIHDDNCERLLGIKKNVNQLTSQELRNRKIIFNNEPSASNVLTLGEAFEKFGSHFVIYLDVKLHTIHMAEKMATLIRKKHLESTTIVANSNLFFISYIEFFYPEINTVMEGFTPGKEWIYNLIPKKLKPDYFSSFAEDVNAEHIEWLRQRDLQPNRIVYGVTNKDLDKVLDSGIQKIILDYDSGMHESLIKYR